MKLNIDILNTFLIVGSLLLAIIFPIPLFLVVYAVLGPLHYLTEIRWIEQKGYFIPNGKIWLYLALVLCLIFCTPYLFDLLVQNSLFNADTIDHWNTKGKQYINWVFSSGLTIAFAFLILKKSWQKLLAITSGILFSYFLNQSTSYNLWIGVFLPTLIHVYIFMIFFMIYGNLKTKSISGWVNVTLMLVIPIIIWLLPIDANDFLISDPTKEIFTENKFHHLNVYLGELLGIKKQRQFFFYEVIDIKLQIFIAFAYTYHYLNWFSKTSIIGWHKNLSLKKSIVLIVIWMVFVGLFIIDYRLGFTISLFISVLHVILEFPINILSIKAIGQKFLMIFTK